MAARQSDCCLHLVMKKTVTFLLEFALYALVKEHTVHLITDNIIHIQRPHLQFCR